MTQNQWTDATATDLAEGDIFRYPEKNRRPEQVTARWNEQGEVRLFTRDFRHNVPWGLSVLRPGTPVQIQS